MKIEIPLNEYKGNESVNLQSALQFDLTNKEKMIAPDNQITNFSLFEQYNIERDNCDKFRFIFTINPMCTNVLFNTQSEIVQFEGSNSAIVLTNTNYINKNNITRSDTYTKDNAIQNTSLISRYQAIDDTEYSHPANGGFEYHCGVDIFNNHMLRKNGFVHINKLPSGNVSRMSDYYNTISDYLRNADGTIVKSIVSPKVDRYNETNMHVYTLDNSKSLKDAYIDNISEENGWIGFSNPTNIEIENNSGDTVMINRMLANKGACEFIDMYPDRSLFSFIPKYNKYRKRLERNWDYCITYPYKSDYEMINKVFGGENQTISTTVHSGTNTYSTNVIFCKSPIKHNLNRGDLISIYYYSGTAQERKFVKYDQPVRVLAVGDNEGGETETVFSIKTDDVRLIIDLIFPDNLYFKKTINGVECDYYFRKYKKLKKIDSNGNRTLDLDSDLNKCAYAENIYGDRIAQIVFTDDIDLNGLVDHHGRKPSEVYLTIVKRNKGYDKWYGQHGVYNAEDIEFSHCFGPVTSGLYFGESEGSQFDYNIRYLHNIHLPSEDDNKVNRMAFSALGETVLRGVPKTIESGITMDDYDDFFGDIVEFDRYNYLETELSPVLHRFNTAQREWVDGSRFANLRYNKIVYDDFDLDSNGNSRPFTVSLTDMSYVEYSGQTIQLFANANPEGYYYNPHTRIAVGEDEIIAATAPAKRINSSSGIGYYNISEDKTVITITSPVNYGFVKHAHLALYDAGTKIVSQQIDTVLEIHPTTTWGEIVGVSGTTVTIEFNGDVFHVIREGTDISEALNPNGNYKQRYGVYWTSVGVPTYSIFVSELSSFVWRSLVKPSKMSNDMELFDTPFANGRFYIEKNITFYNRRQDSDGRFGLLFAKNPIFVSPFNFFHIEGHDFNIQQVFDFYNNIVDVCY